MSIFAEFKVRRIAPLRILCGLAFATLMAPQLALGNGLRCDSIFGDKSEQITERVAPNRVAPLLSARERLMKSILVANVHMPQIDHGVRMMVVSATLKDSSLLAEALAPISHAEVNEAAERMNRAHAAFGIRHRSAGHPEVTRESSVSNERLRELVNGFQEHLIRDLINIASRAEMDRPVWKELRNHDSRRFQRDRFQILRELQFFLERQAAKEGSAETDFALFARSLVNTTDSSSFKDFSQLYREHIRKLISEGRMIGHSERSMLDYQVKLRLEKYFKDQVHTIVDEKRRESVSRLYIWGFE